MLSWLFYGQVCIAIPAPEGSAINATLRPDLAALRCDFRHGFSRKFCKFRLFRQNKLLQWWCLCLAHISRRCGSTRTQYCQPGYDTKGRFMTCRMRFGYDLYYRYYRNSMSILFARWVWGNAIREEVRGEDIEATRYPVSMNCLNVVSLIGFLIRLGSYGSVWTRKPSMKNNRVWRIEDQFWF